MRVLCLTMVLLLAMLVGGRAPAQVAPTKGAITVSMVPEAMAVAPGQTVALAFVMRPRSGWHGYWQNPGDAGTPDRVEWQLPAGVSVGPLRYPVPERLMIAGLMNYVYGRGYALLAELRVPENACRAHGCRSGPSLITLPARSRSAFLSKRPLRASCL